MKRDNFLKSLATLFVAPSILANIKPEKKVFKTNWVKEEDEILYVVSKEGQDSWMTRTEYNLRQKWREDYEKVVWYGIPTQTKQSS